MAIHYGLFPETFKLSLGEGSGFSGACIDSAPTSLRLTACRNSTAAFQLLLACDGACNLTVGKSLYLSQRIGAGNMRLSVESALATTVRIEALHQVEDGRRYADALLSTEAVELAAGEICALYCECQVPRGTAPGTYAVTVRLFESGLLGDETPVAELTATVQVYDYTMKDPSDYRFYLDLWQHPANIARKAEVHLWSDEHFAVLDGYLKTLGALGQKAATLIVSEIPWFGQDCRFKEERANLFEYSMIPITKSLDGTFIYDFTLMQRYIDLCAKHGICQELSLYGLANVWGSPSEEVELLAPDYPDRIRLRYYDASDGTYRFMRKASEIDGYIKALEAYFIATGQIDRVRLVADEPADVEAYRKSICHIMDIAPAFKLKAAINHAEFVPAFGKEVYDFVPSIESLCAEYDQLKHYQSSMEGKRFLWYVCCGPDYPNTFLRSGLVESLFVGVLTSYVGFQGFLRWAYTEWPDDPRTDLRCGHWAAGDTHFVYPSGSGAPLLTLRYQALKRGIELFEMLEELKERCGAEEVARAFGFVVREKDVRTYYAQKLPLEEICSVEARDYEAMKQYVLECLRA